MKISEPARIIYAFLIAPLILTVLGSAMRIDSFSHESFRNYLGWTSLVAYAFSWPPLLLSFLIFRKLGMETIKNYTLGGCVVGSMIFLSIATINGEHPLVMFLIGAVLAGSISFVFALIRGARRNRTSKPS